MVGSVKENLKELILNEARNGDLDSVGHITLLYDVDESGCLSRDFDAISNIPPEMLFDVSLDIINFLVKSECLITDPDVVMSEYVPAFASLFGIQLESRSSKEPFNKKTEEHANEKIMEKVKRLS